MTAVSQMGLPLVPQKIMILTIQSQIPHPVLEVHRLLLNLYIPVVFEKKEWNLATVLLQNLSFVPKVLLLLSLTDGNTCFVFKGCCWSKRHPKRTANDRIFSPLREAPEWRSCDMYYWIPSFSPAPDKVSYYCNISLILV